MVTRRGVAVGALAALLALNTYSGIAKIQSFRHGFRGAKALGRAELNTALASLRKSLWWEPNDSAYHVAVGRVINIAQTNGLPLEALERRKPLEVLGVGVAAVTRGIVLNPGDAWSWFNLAEVYQGYGASRARLEKMRRAGEAAISGAAPVEAPLEGEPGLNQEDRIAAAATLMAADLEPEFFFYHDHLAILYWDRGLVEAAGQEIRQALALMPRLPLHQALSRDEFVRALSGPILEGIDEARPSPNIEPTLAPRARAGILERLGRLEESIKANEDLCRLGGNDVAAECNVNIGRLYQALGKHQESIPFLETAVQHGGYDGTTALSYLGAAHSKLGDRQKAADEFRDYVARRPEDMAGYLGLAVELEAIGKGAEAEEILKATVRRFPDEPAAYESVLRNLVGRGKLKQAEAYAEALTKKDPGNPLALDVLRQSMAAGPGVSR